MCKDIKVITNLCVFNFENEEKVLQIESIHPGVKPNDIIENTGIEISIPENFEITREPNDEEIYLLRNRIDPEGVYI